MHPHPGEVWLADLGLAAKTRPVVIVSRYDPDAPRALVPYAPLTTQQRPSSYEVPLPRVSYLDRESVVNVQGLGSIPMVRLEKKLGKLSKDAFARVKIALTYALDLKSE
ncbi:type II toxin-antitoxin system PemK/MazF family toxin [Paludibaculum fermentans]|uniref:type II toxin-antitoxin system PemK/MazF family toxin n=1 Tax=Paludibaculum fermentans TaxID=1473598 RepID=UPI003EC07CD0